MGGEGGSYRYDDGKIVRVEAPTAPHPDGGAPRDQDGHRMDRPKPDQAPSGDAATSATVDAALTTPQRPAGDRAAASEGPVGMEGAAAPAVADRKSASADWRPEAVRRRPRRE